MKYLKVLAVFVVMSFLTIACGGSGGDGAGGGDTTGNAGGSYSYDDTSQTLSITITSSDFDGDCGPEPGTEDFTVTSLTATTMVWEDSDSDVMTWTRTNGNDGDMEGTWNMSFDEVTMQLVIDGAGNFTISGTCGGSGGGVGSGPSGSADGCEGNIEEVNDFVGTWTGTASYAIGSDLGSSLITVQLAGIDPTTITVTTDTTVSTESCLSVLNGSLRFPIPNSAPDDPDCANWGVFMTGTLDVNGTTMTVSAEGNFCNDTPGTITGSLSK